MSHCQLSLAHSNEHVLLGGVGDVVVRVNAVLNLG